MADKEATGGENMSENWLQKTIEVSDVIDRLIAKYTPEGINEITSGEEYQYAQAAIALALNEALNKTNLTDRKKRKAGHEMIGDLMNGLTVAFMLGYDCAKNREKADAE